MSARLIIDGNAVYEIDEDCLKKQRKKAAWAKSAEEETTKVLEKEEADPISFSVQ